MNPDILLMCVLTIFDTYPDYRSTTLGSYDRLLALLLVLDVPQQCIDVSYNSLLALLEALESPPLNILNIRSLLFFDHDSDIYNGKDVFSYLSQRRRVFYYATGETPETFTEITLIFNNYQRPQTRTRQATLLSGTNKILMTLMWLKSYPTYNILAIVFDVPIEFVCSTVQEIWPVLHACMQSDISWPSRREWLNMRGKWPELQDVVGCIDGTSHEIYRPCENQGLYFSGHRRYHCVHTQVVIDNELNIRYIESGFTGHNNDAQTFNMMTAMGNGLVLDIPRECYILGDCIYASRHPVITPFTQAQLRRQPRNQRRQSRSLNRRIRRRRVYVEHIIKLIKLYQIISTLYRHSREDISKIVCLCAQLAARRARLLF